MNELTIMGTATAMTVGELFSDQKNIDDIISRVRAEVKTFKPDLSTKKGRKEIASFAHKIAKTKVAVDNAGKDLTEDVRGKITLINNERARVVAEMQIIQDDVRKDLTAWENAETDRTAAHEENLLTITNAINVENCSPDEIKTAIINVENLFENRDWEEFSVRGKDQHDITVKILENIIAREVKRIAEQAELARLRKESAEREIKERDERIARDAAEKAKLKAEEKAHAEKAELERKAKAERDAAEAAKLEAEQKAQAEIKAVEDAKLEVIRKAAAEKKQIEDEKAEVERKLLKQAADTKQAKIDTDIAVKKAAQAERERIERERQAEIDAQNKRELNKVHKAKINNAALKELVVAGLSENAAKTAISEIAKSNIPNVTISY